VIERELYIKEAIFTDAMKMNGVLEDRCVILSYGSHLFHYLFELGIDTSNPLQLQVEVFIFLVHGCSFFVAIMSCHAHASAFPP